MRAVLIFLIVFLATFAYVRSENKIGIPADLAVNEAAMNWTLKACGSLMAACAAFALLLRGLVSETLERQLGLVLPLLGGVLLVATHWSVALALGAISVALIARECCGRLCAPKDRA